MCVRRGLTSPHPSTCACCCAAGATGGFAGGERGVKAFVRDGEVKIRQPGQPGGQGPSPLSIAFLVMFAGAAGAAISTQVYDPAAGTIKMDVIEVGIGARPWWSRRSCLSGFRGWGWTTRFMREAARRTFIYPWPSEGSTSC
jgi:hypothetical protein